MKQRRLLYGVGAALLLLIVIAIASVAEPSPRAETAVHEPSAPLSEGPAVQIGDVLIPVEIAKGSAAVEKGLSGRPSLPADTGMLFIFQKPGKYNFWMPDMYFPIDILWIAEEKVIGIEHDVSNIFDPKNPRFYSPPSPVAYVLEVNAGFSKLHGIEPGDPVLFIGL